MNTTSPTTPQLVAIKLLQFFHAGPLYITSFLAALWLVKTTVNKLIAVLSDKTTPLNGPANTSLLFGLYRHINESEDPGLVYEGWAKEYGPAFKIPGGFGSSRILICDPRANAHFYSKETFGYVQTKLSRVFIENLVSNI
jgi:hypothetical protein